MYNCTTPKESGTNCSVYLNARTREGHYFAAFRNSFRIFCLVLSLALLSNKSFGFTTNYYASPASIGAPTGGTTTVCVGASNSSFTATVTDCSGSFGTSTNNWTAEWFFNGALVYTSALTTSAPSVDFTIPAGTFTYTTPGTFSGTGAGSGLFLKVSWDAGTSPTACGTVASGVYVVSANSTTITVNGPPTGVSASLSGNPKCVGNTLTLNGAATGATSYLWSGPAGGAAMTSTTTVSTQINSLNALNAGIYTLTATNTCGSALATTASLTVNTLPSAVTASLSASPLCVGSLLTLNGGATGASSYLWSGPAGGAAMTSTTTVSTQVTSVTALNAGIYTLTATNACGSATASTAALTVNKLPVFTGVTETPNPACVGGSMVLAATTSSAGAGPIAYAWTGPGGTAITNPASLTTASVNPLVAANAGNYTITATVAGCPGSATRTSTAAMVVTPAPSGVSASLLASSLCAGSLLTLNGGATGASSYVWAGPAGGAAMTSTTTVSTQVTSVTALNAGVYTLTASNACGSATATTAALAVNQLPVFTDVVETTNPACIGGSMVLSAPTSTAGAGPVVYSWSGPGGDVINPGSLTTASVNPLSAGDAGVYSISATVAGCPGTSFASSSVPLALNSQPISVSPFTTPSPVCAGDIFYLNGNVAGGTSLTFSWAGPNTVDIADPSLASTSINSASVLDAGTYTLTVTAAGCAPIVAVTGPQEVNAVPSIILASILTNPVCAGDNVPLIGDDSGDGGGVVYSWTGPVSGDISAASSESAAISSVSLADAGVYTLTATAPGCPGGTFAVTNVLTVNAVPASITASVSPAVACAGDDITLSGGDSGDGFNVNYSWAGPVTGDIDNSLSENTVIFAAATYDAGVYTLTATADGCAGSVVATTGTLVLNTLPSTVTADLSASPACRGDNVTLIGGDSGDGVGVDYSWTGPVPGDITGAGSESAAVSPVASADAGVYTLTATAAGCPGSTFAVTGVLNVNALPSTITASVSPVVACAGDNITLSGGDSGDGINVTYSWTGPFTGDINDPSSESTFILAAASYDGGIYTLSATADGCAATAVATTGTLVLNSLPTFITADLSESPACPGDNVTLVGGDSGDGVGVDYSWTGPVPGDIVGAGSESAVIPAVASADAGIYTLTATVAGCSGSATAVTSALVVNALPTTITAVASPAVMCAGDNITLTGGDSGDGIGVAYAWTGPVTGDIMSASSESASVPGASVADAGVYKLTATMPGCAGSMFVVSNAVTIGAAADVSNFSTPSAASVCQGAGSAVTVNSSSLGDGSFTATYNLDGANIVSGHTAVLTMSGGTGSFMIPGTDLPSTGTTTVTITVVQASVGCSSSLTANNVATFTVTPTPTAAPSNSGYICIGGTVTLTANPSGGAVGYTWSGANLAATTGAVTTATPIATTTYSLTVSGSGGCSSGIQYVTTVSVSPTPAAAPSNSGYICNGGTVTLSANPSGFATVFSWTGANLISGSGATTTATPTATTIYTLTVSDGSGQPGCAPATPYFTTVSVNPVPTASPTNNGYICNGGSVTLTANPANFASTFTWTGPGLASGSGAITSAAPTTTATYTLTVTDGSGKSGCAPSTPYFTTVSVNPTPVAAAP